MCLFSSEKLIKSAETLINDYDLNPYDAWMLTYEKRAEIYDVLENIKTAKNNLSNEMEKRGRL